MVGGGAGGNGEGEALAGEDLVGKLEDEGLNGRLNGGEGEIGDLPTCGGEREVGEGKRFQGGGGGGRRSEGFQGFEDIFVGLQKMLKWLSVGVVVGVLTAAFLLVGHGAEGKTPNGRREMRFVC